VFFINTEKGAIVIQGPELASILEVKPQLINSLRDRYELIDGEDMVVLGNKRRYYTPAGLRKIFLNRDYDFKKRVVCVAQCKGGVGKSSISVAIANKASKLGFKTLLIDLDKQGNATDQVWPDAREKQFDCLYDIVKKNAKFKNSIIKISETLDLFPSNLKNQLLDLEITANGINKGSFFKNILDSLEYDLIVFDTEPNLSQVNAMAMAYSQLNIAPVRMDKSSIDGLELVLDFIDNLKDQWPEINVVTKVLINAFDKRMTTEAVKKIGEIQNLGVKTFDTMIRTDQSFVKAQETGDLKVGSKAYEDITSLIVEVLDLNQVKKKQQ
jgi:chromosome partitioning protein